jgi:hypothetical protein
MEEGDEQSDTTNKLTPADIRQFLLHIEENGGRGVDFSKKYASSQEFYGPTDKNEPNNRRRKFQHKLYKLREKTPTAYIADLAKFRISPCPATSDEEFRYKNFVEQQERQKVKAKKTTASCAKEARVPEQVAVDLPDEELEDATIIVTMSASQKEMDSVVTMEEVEALLENMDITPPRLKRSGAVSSASRKKGTTPAKHDKHDTPAFLKAMFARQYTRPDLGSSENPYIVIVNLVKPELNGPVLVKKITNYHHEDGYYYTAYHFEAVIVGEDANQWELSVPDSPPPGLVNRILVLKSPSVSWPQKSLRDQLDAFLPDATQTADSQFFAEFNSDESRHHVYHCYVFPEGVRLDNSIIYTNKTPPGRVPRQFSRISLPENKSFRLMVLSWMIVEEGAVPGLSAATGADDDRIDIHEFYKSK